MRPRLPRFFSSIVKNFLSGRNPRGFSIRSRLIFLVFAGVLPLLILSAVMFWRDVQLHRESREHGMRDTVRALSLAVDREVGKAGAILVTLAASPYLDSGDFKSFYELSSRVAEEHKGSWIVLFDSSGQQIINTRRRFGSALPNTLRDAVDSPAAKRDDLSLGAASELRQVLETGKPVVTDLFMGIVSKRPTVSTSVPVKRHGQVAYALKMGILPESFTAFLEEHGFPGDWIAMLVDRKGIVIGRTADPEKFVGRAASPELISKANEGWGTGHLPEGVPVYFAFARSNVTGWSVIIGAPQSSIDAPMNQSMRIWGGGAVLLVISGLTAALLLGRRIAEPLSRLASSAERIQQGEWIELDPWAAREVKELHKALVKAAQAEREAANERQRQLVEQRMRHLAEVSAALTESLEYENTLNRLADLMVPEHADWCVIDLVQDGSDVCRRVAVRTSRKEKDQFAQELSRDYAPDLSRPHPIMTALQTGQTEFTFGPDAPSWLNTRTRNERHGFLLEQMDASGVIIVPLRVQERIAGTFSLVASRYSGRTYTIADVEFAKEVGRRASIALDKAWLYREVQKELAERKRSESQLQAMYQFVERRHRAKSLEEIYDAALDGILAALSCQRASILLRDDSGVMRFVAWRGLSENYRKAVEGHWPWESDDANPQPVCVPDITAAAFDASLRTVVTDEGIGAFGFFPVVINERLAGKFMTYYDSRHSFKDEEIELGLTIAGQLALGIQHTRAERALHESEQRYRAVVDSQAEMVCRFRPDGTILFVNVAYARARGTTPEALVGCNFWGFVADEDRPAVQAMLGRLTPASPEVRIENRFETSGGVRWTLWTNRALSFDAGGHWTEAQSTGIDITEHKRAEEALRASEERFRLATSAGKVGVWDWDLDANSVTWSETLYAIHGIDADTFGGTAEAFLEIVHPDDRKLVREAARRARHDRAAYEIEFRVVRPDGRIAWIYTHATVVCSSSGAPARILGATVDITERKRAEAALRRSEERFRTMADSSPVMIWLTDTRGKALFLNRTYLEYFGISAEEAATFDWTQRVHAEDVDAYLSAFQTALKERRTFHYRVRLRRYDGEWRWFESRGNPIVDDAGHLTGFIGSCSDITEIYESQQRLKELDQRKDEFIANMSHEIRSPLTGIMGYADLLLTRLTDPFDTHCLKTIKESGNYLIEIVNDILDLSKIEAGKLVLNIGGISVHTVLAEVQGLMDVRARQKKLPLFLRYDGVLPESVQTDRTRLRQILVNLVSNAIKFTEIGSVQIVARYLKDDCLLQIEVVDTGIGIAPEHQARLFEPFTQADSTNTREYGGTGLGLTITQRLVEMLGGSIAFESELGKGSTFRVTIPTAQQASVPVDAGMPAG